MYAYVNIYIQGWLTTSDMQRVGHRGGFRILARGVGGGGGGRGGGEGMIPRIFRSPYFLYRLPCLSIAVVLWYNNYSSPDFPSYRLW